MPELDLSLPQTAQAVTAPPEASPDAREGSEAPPAAEATASLPAAEEATAPALTPPVGESADGDGDAPALTDGADYAALAAADLAELRRYPAFRELSELSELADPERYGALRELGLSPPEAAAASQYKRLFGEGRGDNRAHLNSSVPRTVSAPGFSMSNAELREARELFPGMPDREIEALYRRAR